MKLTQKNNSKIETFRAKIKKYKICMVAALPCYNRTFNLVSSIKLTIEGNTPFSTCMLYFRRDEDIQTPKWDKNGKRLDIDFSISETSAIMYMLQNFSNLQLELKMKKNYEGILIRAWVNISSTEKCRE